MQGPEAVQSFYIISGFYMALILNEKYSTQPNAYRLFMSNRLLKLMPVYWLVLVLVVLISIIVGLTTHTNWFSLQPYMTNTATFNPGTLVYLFFSNLFILGQDFSLFLGLNPTTATLYFTEQYANSKPAVNEFMLVPQAWTIGIEIMFYIIAPFIVRKKTVWIVLFFLLAAAIKYFLLSSGFNYDPWSYRFFPAELMYFFMGILSYKLYLALKKTTIPSWILPLSFFSVLAVVLGYNYLHSYIRTYAFFPCLAIAIPFVFMYTKKSSLDRKIGELSYPVYICHVLMKGLVFLVIGFRENVSVSVAILSLIFAFAANEFLLKRIEAYRQRRVNMVAI